MRFLNGFLVTVAVLVTGLGVAVGHPEEFTERAASGAELAKRQHLAHKRHLAARSCASTINAFHTKRRAKRGLDEQQVFVSGNGDAADLGEHHDMDVVQNHTCVTAPEIEEGPYYVNNELIRYDLREDQGGVTLQLDIGVIDTATCEPIPNAFIEIWSANATGVYGGFESNGGGRGGPPPGGPGRRPPGRGFPRPPPGGPPRGSPAMSSSNTWLRGGSGTDEEGTVELWTIYPGFYSGRTIHVHLMVHMGWEEADNGTLVSHSGSLKHIGQLFFDEDWNDKVLSTGAYLDNKGRRTLNVDDHDFRRASIDGSSAVVQLEQVGETVEDGLIGFITVGIDTTAEYSIHSSNYNNVTLESSVQEVDI